MHSVYNFCIGFDGQQFFSTFLILFSVIDVLGGIPIIISLRKKAGSINAYRVTVASGVIMLSFLFLGQSLLDLFYIDVASFSVAGSIILFILGLEMILNVSIFKVEFDNESSSIVPLAFPIVAGTGTLATLLTLKLEYANINILCGTLANLLCVYPVISYSVWIERKLGKLGINVMHKVMGMILLALAVKLFRTHFAVPV